MFILGCEWSGWFTAVLIIYLSRFSLNVISYLDKEKSDSSTLSGCFLFSPSSLSRLINYPCQRNSVITSMQTILKRKEKKHRSAQPIFFHAYPRYSYKNKYSWGSLHTQLQRKRKIHSTFVFFRISQWAWLCQVWYSSLQTYFHTHYLFFTCIVSTSTNLLRVRNPYLYVTAKHIRLICKWSSKDQHTLLCWMRELLLYQSPLHLHLMCSAEPGLQIQWCKVEMSPLEPQWPLCICCWPLRLLNNLQRQGASSVRIKTPH